MSELSQDDSNRLIELILAGQKIEAIKEYRELTGQGLKESKEFIDALEGQVRDGSPASFVNSPVAATASRLSVGNMPEEDAKTMTEMIFSGRKIEAIQLYRKASGMGLKESKDFIDALENQLRVECPEDFTHAAKTGCSVVIAAGALLAMVAGVVGWV